MSARIVCVDIGSTYTKAALVDVAHGCAAGHRAGADHRRRGGRRPDRDRRLRRRPGRRLLQRRRRAAAGRRRLRGADQRRGRAPRGAVGRRPGRARRRRAAGRRRAGRAARRWRPDVVLLVGGTDGGEASVLRHNAAALAGTDRSVPVVLAGNAAVRDEVAAVLRDGGLPVREADNVLPDIGRLAPESARTAIREVFLEHVIGGDRLSTDPRLRQWVRAVTPDAVLEGVVGARRAAAGRRGAGRRRPGRRRRHHRRLLRARPGRRAGDARPRGGRGARPAAHRGGRPRGVAERRRPARPRRAPRGCRAGRRPAVAGRGGGDRGAAPAPARRGRLRARAARARAASASSSSPAGCSGTPTRPPWTASSPGSPPTGAVRAAC